MWIININVPSCGEFNNEKSEDTAYLNRQVLGNPQQEFRTENMKKKTLLSGKNETLNVPKIYFNFQGMLFEWFVYIILISTVRKNILLAIYGDNCL